MRLAERCAALPAAVRRTLAVTMLVGVIACAWMLIMLPLQALYESQQLWRSDARQLLAYSKASVVALDQLQAEVTAMRSSALWSKLYRADRGGPAAGRLQAEVSTLLANARASAQSFTPLRSTGLEDLTQVGIHVTTAMRIDQLQQFISSVRTHSKYLRIEQLTISAPQSQPADENPTLSIELDISGFELTTSPAEDEARRP